MPTRLKIDLLEPATMVIVSQKHPRTSRSHLPGPLWRRLPPRATRRTGESSSSSLVKAAVLKSDLAFLAAFIDALNGGYCLRSSKQTRRPPTAQRPKTRPWLRTCLAEPIGAKGLNGACQKNKDLQRIGSSFSLEPSRQSVSRPHEIPPTLVATPPQRSFILSMIVISLAPHPLNCLRCESPARR